MTKKQFIMSFTDNGKHTLSDKQCNALTEFFDSNVCIPKGDNRHPYADVLHEWIEGAAIQQNYENGWTDMDLVSDMFIAVDARIKPSEPVYKYRYEIFYANTKMFTVDYLTDDELNTDIYLKVEETKGVRE